jgi:hypothetical protein
VKYYQCWLQQETEILLAWIPERGAKKGARVELKGEEGLWEVTTVYEPGFDDKWLVEKRKKDRNSLPSIKGKKKEEVK